MLSDLGLPGAAAYVIFIVGTLIVGIRMRFRARRPENQAAVAAALLAVGSWVVHSSADWLWQLGGVTWPAVLLLGGLLGRGGRRAPRRRRRAPARSRTGRARLPTPTPGRVTPVVVRPILVRIAMAGVALLLLVSGSVHYLSLRYLAIAGERRFVGLHRRGDHLGRATEPLLSGALHGDGRRLRAGRTQRALSGDLEGTLTDLALAAGAWEEAIDREPLAWELAPTWRGWPYSSTGMPQWLRASSALGPPVRRRLRPEQPARLGRRGEPGRPRRPRSGRPPGTN